MGATATMYDDFRKLLSEVSGLTEHKGAVSEAGLPSFGAAGPTPRSDAQFVVTLPTSTARAGRQRTDMLLTVDVRVGLLITVPQSDRPAAYFRSLDLEDTVLAATIGSPKIAGWNITYLTSERTDVGAGAYLGLVLSYEVTGGVTIGSRPA